MVNFQSLIFGFCTFESPLHCLNIIQFNQLIINLITNFSKIVYSDLSHIAPEHYTKQMTHKLTEIKAVASPDDRSVFIQVLESAYRFTLGAVAGGTIN